MPLTFEMTPIHGISVTLAFDGDLCTIQVEGFYSTEDGGQFIDRLEEMSRTFLNRAGIMASQIDNFLLILDKKNQATLYCNEFIFTPLVRANRIMDAGEHVHEDDLVDFEALELFTRDKKKVVIPEDCGVIFMFSIGWRKALYFNFTPLHPNASEKLTEMPQVFGRLFGHLFFQEKTKLKDEQWKRLFAWGWFPFVGMTKKELGQCAAWTEQDRYPKGPVLEVCKRFQKKIPLLIQSWKTRPEFEVHLPFIEAAWATLQQGNFISTVQTLMPRIQGIMHGILNRKAGQKYLADGVVKNHDPRSLLMPEKFKEYLLTCYFHDFNMETGDCPLARHSIAHGVSDAADYDEIAATLPFFIFDQIFFFLPGPKQLDLPHPLERKAGGVPGGCNWETAAEAKVEDAGATESGISHRDTHERPSG